MIKCKQTYPERLVHALKNTNRVSNLRFASLSHLFLDKIQSGMKYLTKYNDRAKSYSASEWKIILLILLSSLNGKNLRNSSGFCDLFSIIIINY